MSAEKLDRPGKTDIRQIEKLLNSDLQVINLGLELFADTFADQEIPFVHVDWQPPAAGDQNLMDMLSALK